MAWLDRQSFLGANSDAVLKDLTVGLAGLGGGNSHTVQQFAHLGAGNYVLADDDEIEDSNLNRLVGGTWRDVQVGMSKAEIAKRIILAVNPHANVVVFKAKWQMAAEHFKTCDLVIGGLDSVRAKADLEDFCRRLMIPYIDMGMDVHPLDAPGEFLVAGQVALSVPGHQCLRCMRIVTDAALDEEAKRYGHAGGKPQVVWPNGVLASTAVGLAVKLFTPWCRPVTGSEHLVYDGNVGTIAQDDRFRRFYDRPCPHFPPSAVGDPSFDIRVPRVAMVENVEMAVPSVKLPLLQRFAQSIARGLKSLFDK